jgi:ribonuclease-3
MPLLSSLKKIFRSPKKEKKDSSLEPGHNDFEKVIGYSFKNPALLLQALKHRSHIRSPQETRQHSNERLEFLGDTVLNLIITDYLFAQFPQKTEGDLTKMKSYLVSSKALVEKAYEWQLNKFILVSPSEAKMGGRSRPSILADAYEAVLGALFLDAGFEKTKILVQASFKRNIHPFLERIGDQNYKSTLLEYAQKNRLGLPYYRLREESGPDHQKVFTIDVMLNDKILGTGNGSSKKKAEQVAAQIAVNELKEKSLLSSVPTRGKGKKHPNPKSV